MGFYTPGARRTALAQLSVALAQDISGGVQHCAGGTETANALPDNLFALPLIKREGVFVVTGGDAAMTEGVFPAPGDAERAILARQDATPGTAQHFARVAQTVGKDGFGVLGIDQTGQGILLLEGADGD